MRGASGPDFGRKVWASTLKDLARHAGVSVSTASLVMRDSPLVSDSTRSKVLDSARAIAYVRNRSAASLRAGRSGTIGLVVPEITNPFYAEFTAGFEGALNRNDCVTFFGNSAESLSRQEMFIARMREQRVDGIAISPAEGTAASALERLAECGVPCVQAIRYVLGLAMDHVGTDSRLGMAIATRHLVALGHRRIAFVGGGGVTSATRDRRAGYFDGLRQAGLPVDVDLVIDCPIDRRTGAGVLDRLFGLVDPATAAVCYADVIGLGMIHALLDRGLTPGRDFAVVGHDDIEEAAWSHPGLSTVAVTPRRIGAEAARMLVERIADPSLAARRYLLEPRLIVRESCGGASGAVDTAMEVSVPSAQGGAASTSTDDKSGMAPAVDA